MAGRKIISVILGIGIISLLGCAAHREKVTKSELETIEEWPQTAKGEMVYPKKVVSRDRDYKTLKEKVKEYLPAAKKIETPKKIVIAKKPSHIAPAKDIQTALKNAGYDPGKIDNKIGSKTTSAIKAFQKDNGLKDDGVVGQRTWNLLSKYLTSPAVTAPTPSETLPPVSLSTPTSGMKIATPATSTVPITEVPVTITETTQEGAPEYTELVMEEAPQEQRNFMPIIIAAIIVLAIILAVSIYRRTH